MERFPSLSPREKRLLAGFVLALVVAVGLYAFLGWMGSGFSWPFGGEKQPYVAVLLPERDGTLAETTRQAVSWALENPPPGVASSSLKVRFYKVGASPDRIAWTVQRIAHRPNVVAFLGPLDLPQAVAAWNAAQGLPVITTISTAPAGKEGLPRGLYRIPTPDERQGEALATFCLNQGWDKVALITDGTSYAQGITQRLTASLSPVSTLDLSEHPLYARFLRPWRKQGVQAVLWVAGPESVDDLAKALSDLNWQPVVLASDLAISDSLQQLGQTYPVYYTTPMFLAVDFAETPVAGGKPLGALAQKPYAYETIQGMWALIAAWETARGHRERLNSQLESLSLQDPWTGIWHTFHQGMWSPEQIFLYRVAPGRKKWQANPLVEIWER